MNAFTHKFLWSIPTSIKNHLKKCPFQSCLYIFWNGHQKAFNNSTYMFFMLLCIFPMNIKMEKKWYKYVIEQIAFSNLVSFILQIHIWFEFHSFLATISSHQANWYFIHITYSFMISNKHFSERLAFIRF